MNRAPAWAIWRPQPTGDTVTTSPDISTSGREVVGVFSDRESFEASVLADGLGRVADVQAVDLDGEGRTDLLVAAFGWMENGSLLWLERSGGSGADLTFTPHVLDSRPGFTDVRAADLNRDGRPDLALGFMDLGVVDPGQAHRGEPLASYVTLWQNLGPGGPVEPPEEAAVIDWRRGAPDPGR